jgi:hypothetical protein
MLTRYRTLQSPSFAAENPAADEIEVRSFLAAVVFHNLVFLLQHGLPKIGRNVKEERYDS